MIKRAQYYNNEISKEVMVKKAQFWHEALSPHFASDALQSDEAVMQVKKDLSNQR